MIKVALVGTAPLSQQLAPYNDKEWQIWACSPGNMGRCPRVDLWFEIHALCDMTAAENQAWSLNYFGWLKAQSFPVMMQEKNDLIPQAQVYPLKLMLKKFGRNWFTSSVAYMMAYAIHLGVTEIALFGIDMAADVEHYTGQKAGCLRFIEIAKEHGIKVHVPFESCLPMPPPLYGYSEATNFGRRMNAVEHQIGQERARMAAELDALVKKLSFFDGAMEQVRYIKRTFTDGEDADLDLGELEKQVAAASPPTPKFADFQVKSPGGLLLPNEMPGPTPVLEPPPPVQAAQGVNGTGEGYAGKGGTRKSRQRRPQAERGAEG